MKKLTEEEQKAKEEWLEYHKKHSEEPLSVEEIRTLSNLKMEKRNVESREQSYLDFETKLVDFYCRQINDDTLVFDYKSEMDKCFDRHIRFIDWNKHCKNLFGYIKNGIKRIPSTENYDEIIPLLKQREMLALLGFWKQMSKDSSNRLKHRVFLALMNKDSMGNLTEKEKKVFDKMLSERIAKQIGA